RRGQRRSRRPTEHVAPLVALEEEREVRAAPLPDAPSAQLPRAEAVLVGERANAVEDQERRPGEALDALRRLDDIHAYDPTVSRRRLYLMRHGEGSYFLPDGSPGNPAEDRAGSRGRSSPPPSSPPNRSPSPGRSCARSRAAASPRSRPTSSSASSSTRSGA